MGSEPAPEGTYGHYLFDELYGILQDAFSTRSFTIPHKILHHKRPNQFPILDKNMSPYWTRVPTGGRYIPSLG